MYLESREVKESSTVMMDELTDEKVCCGDCHEKKREPIIGEWNPYLGKGGPLGRKNYRITEKSPEKDLMRVLDNYNVARDYVTIRVLNRRINADICREAYGIEFYDMKAVASLVLRTQNGFFHVYVTDKVAERWGVEASEVFGRAYRNMCVLGEFHLQDICGAIEDSIGENLSDGRSDRMFVVKEDALNSGAAAIVCPDLLLKIADQLDSDLYILPSSVSEIIVMRAPDEDPDHLAWMVKDANENVLEEEDILSSHVFLLDREDVNGK